MTFDNKVLRFTLEFTVGGVEKCERFANVNSLSAIASVDVPPWFTSEMADFDGTVFENVIVYKWPNEFHCDCSFCGDNQDFTFFHPERSHVKIVDGSPEKVTYTVHKGDSDDEPDNEPDEEFEDALCNFFNFYHDNHWNCYCKERSVCGCGCDELHDGWSSMDEGLHFYPVSEMI